MSYSRRDFLKAAGLAVSGTSLMNALPLSIQTIQKAMSIDPDEGTTFEDAEHVVLLMQENRSFDHVFGSLQGVRGFNDPRAIRLPDNNLSWLQTNKKGKTYLPYRLDIKDSKVTWIGGLPHQWGDQVDARNKGRYDNWLEAKSYDGKMPFTMGYYTREDLPFYYALADAFSISDHHFCSSLTGTTPNRLYYWTGTVREEQKPDSPANISNGFVNYSHNAHWKTFPEVLEEEDISWRVYQNELSVGVGLEGDQVPWLENFTNNPLEWFSQFHVNSHTTRIKHLKKRLEDLKEEVTELSENSEKRKEKEALIDEISKDLKENSAENFKKLPEQEQSIHKKAFTTNVKDPLYHELTSIDYEEDGERRKLNLPKGDPLYQFRTDVENGELPRVSWLIGSQRFSDHPSSPWFGAWYVSEVLKVLTDNPEVWKKTIFILTYDENDGYFDHIPPFTPADPEDKKSGFSSKGIDNAVEYVTKTQAENLKDHFKNPGRVSPIGMGYRVPFIVASPWSRGGKVNSQISDNTSVLMFLEKFLSQKENKPIKADKISAWRRAVSSDLTSIFSPYNGEDIKLPEFVKQKPFAKGIYNAKFKEDPKGYRPVTEDEIKQINQGETALSIMPQQEEGTRPTNALPYEFYVQGKQNGTQEFEIEMEASDHIFGDKASGAPFYVYSKDPFTVRNYAVKAGDKLKDKWTINEQGYHLSLYGPNGFFREFKSKKGVEFPLINCLYEQKKDKKKEFTGNIELLIEGSGEVEIIDNAYGQKTIHKKLKNKESSIIINAKANNGWYDFTVRKKGDKDNYQRYAGHVETGKSSTSDPFMGREV